MFGVQQDATHTTKRLEVIFLVFLVEVRLVQVDWPEDALQCACFERLLVGHLTPNNKGAAATTTFLSHKPNYYMTTMLLSTHGRTRFAC